VARGGFYFYRLAMVARGGSAFRVAARGCKREKDSAARAHVYATIKKLADTQSVD